MRNSRQASPSDLLQFVAPGFLHAMGNAFFAIQGHARLVFNDFERVGPQGDEVLGVCDRASRAIEIYRLLAETLGPSEALPVGQLVWDLAGLLRAPLREAGIKLACAENVVDVRRTVRSREVVRAVVAALQRITVAVPTGFRGELELSIHIDDGVHIEWILTAATGHLPFEIDWTAAIHGATAGLGEHGVVGPTARGGGLRITMPEETVV